MSATSLRTQPHPPHGSLLQIQDFTVPPLAGAHGNCSPVSGAWAYSTSWSISSKAARCMRLLTPTEFIRARIKVLHGPPLIADSPRLPFLLWLKARPPLTSTPVQLQTDLWRVPQQARAGVRV